MGTGMSYVVRRSGARLSCPQSVEYRYLRENILNVTHFVTNLTFTHYCSHAVYAQLLFQEHF
jgi:hypothetical protein